MVSWERGDERHVFPLVRAYGTDGSTRNHHCHWCRLCVPRTNVSESSILLGALVDPGKYSERGETLTLRLPSMGVSKFYGPYHPTVCGSVNGTFFSNNESRGFSSPVRDGGPLHDSSLHPSLPSPSTLHLPHPQKSHQNHPSFHQKYPSLPAS